MALGLSLLLINLDLLISVALLFGSLGFFVNLAMKERQEIWYVVFVVVKHDAVIAPTLISQVDGVIKQTNNVLICTQVPDVTPVIFSYTFAKHDAQVQFATDAGDWTTWGVFGADAVSAWTMDSDLLPHFQIAPSALAQSVWNERRGAMNVTRGDKMYMRGFVDQIAETAMGTGEWDVYFEMMQVIAPWKYVYEDASVSSMRHVALWSLVSSNASDVASAELPSTGYFTNISMLYLGELEGDDPVTVHMGTDIDPDMYLEVDVFGGSDTWLLKGNKNTLSTTFTKMENITGSAYRVFYRHFGSASIAAHRYDFMTYIVQSDEVLANDFVIIEADFIPHKGALFRQELSDTDWSISDYEESWICPVKLSNVQIIFTIVVTAGSGIWDLIVLPKKVDQVLHSMTATGDIVDNSPESNILESAQNRVATIPLHVSMGSQSIVVPIPNGLNKGDAITFDLRNASGLTGFNIMLIQGNVDKRYYSKSSRYMMSPEIFPVPVGGVQF